MKRRQLSPLLDRTSGHHEARLLVREAENRGLLLGRSLFFDECPAWGSASLGEQSGGERDGGQAAQASLGRGKGDGGTAVAAGVLSGSGGRDVGCPLQTCSDLR